MKIKYCLLLFSFFVLQINAACDVKAYKEFFNDLENKSKVFNKIVTLYNPVLNNYNAAQWAQIENYFDCIDQFLRFEIYKENIGLHAMLSTFEDAKDLIKEVVSNFPTDKSALKELINPLYNEQKKVYAILVAALDRISKTTKGKKSDPKLILPDYENFLKELKNYTGRGIEKYKTLRFLEEKGIIKKDNEIGEKASAKAFATKLRILIQALEENKAWYKFGISDQIADFQKIIAILENTYGFTSEAGLSPQVIEKLFLTKDKASFIIVAEAKGLYDALYTLIKKVEAQRQK